MPAWETEFLKLAAVHLQARWNVMGNDTCDEEGNALYRAAWTFNDCAFHMLGMADYAAEMALIAAEHIPSDCTGAIAQSRVAEPTADQVQPARAGVKPPEAPVVVL